MGYSPGSNSPRVCSIPIFCFPSPFGFGILRMKKFKGGLGEPTRGRICASVAGCADNQIERLRLARIVRVLLSPRQNFAGEKVGGYPRQFLPIVFALCLLVTSEKFRSLRLTIRINRS